MTWTFPPPRSFAVAVVLLSVCSQSSFVRSASCIAHVDVVLLRSSTHSSHAHSAEADAATARRQQSVAATMHGRRPVMADLLDEMDERLPHTHTLSYAARRYTTPRTCAFQRPSIPPGGTTALHGQILTGFREVAPRPGSAAGRRSR